MEQHVQVGELGVSLSRASVVDALLPSLRDEVSEFLSEHSLASDFSAFVELAAASFSNVVGMSAMRRGNHEEAGSEWIDLGVRVRGEVARTFTEYEHFVEQVLEAIRSDVRASLRLSLDVV